MVRALPHLMTLFMTLKCGSKESWEFHTASTISVQPLLDNHISSKQKGLEWNIGSRPVGQIYNGEWSEEMQCK